MTPSQLTELKQQLQKFYLLVKSIVEYSNENNAFPHKTIKKVHKINALIKAFADFYPQHAIILWIYDEVSTAMQYVDMFEDLEESVK